MPSQVSQRPVFVLTVALPASTARQSGGVSFDVLADAARRVRSHQVAATWAVSLGTNLVQLADVLRVHAASGNELAWLADATWAGPNARRGQFAVALAERASAAAEADVEISTLVAGDAGNCPSHLDLAAKYGVRAIAGSATPRSRSSQAHPLRFGVWNVPTSVSLSSSGTWWTNAARGAEREIRRAIRTGGVCHVHADLARPETTAVLDRVLAFVERCRVEHRLHVETVGQLVARLSRPKFALRPARSILRAA